MFGLHRRERIAFLHALHTEIAEAGEVSSLVRFLSFVEQVLSSTSCKLHVSTHRNSRIEQSVEFSVFFKLCRASVVQLRRAYSSSME